MPQEGARDLDNRSEKKTSPDPTPAFAVSAIHFSPEISGNRLHKESATLNRMPIYLTISTALHTSYGFHMHILVKPFNIIHIQKMCNVVNQNFMQMKIIQTKKRTSIA
jgi:hypothetical protein